MRNSNDSKPSGAGRDAAAAEAYCSTCNQSFAAGIQTCPHDGARLILIAEQRDVLLGSVLDDRYEVRSALGHGGMGTVYRGWQLSVDREVAIKVIHPGLASDRDSVKRFLREAKLSSRLSEPSIVRVYDFGQSNGILYLVMELLRGHTLASELGNDRRIDVRRTAVIGAQLCDALEAAHAQDIVHRDLKPGNIVILDEPPGRDLIKVLDFGLAKLLDHDAGSKITNPEGILGTPMYMAPEQIEGKPSDPRSDLYALGCILFEMISGVPPFLDTAVSAVLARHLGDTPAPLPPHTPAPMRALVEKLLAKRVEERPQTAREARTMLEHVLESQPRPTTLPMNVPRAPPSEVPVELARTDVAMATPVPRPGRLATPHGSIGLPMKRRNLPRWPIAALLAALAIGVMAFVRMRGPSRATRATRATDAVAQGEKPIKAVRAALPANSMPPVDASADAAPPPVDASADAAPPLDATIRAVHPVHPKVDAGVDDIDFYRPKK